MGSGGFQVSWRCAALISEMARNAKMERYRLFEGLPFDETSLSRAGWIAWDDYCSVVERFETLAGGPEDAVRLFEQYLPIREMHAVATAFVELRLLYQFVFRVIDPLMFPPIAFDYRELADGRLHVAYKVRKGARPCEAFGLLSTGGIRAIPRYLGLPLAKVDATVTPREGVYLVSLPRSRTLFAKTRRRARKELNRIVGLLETFTDEITPVNATRIKNPLTLDERIRRASLEHDLTERQSQVLRAIVEGRSNKEIAALLDCAENTVELHASNLFRRMGAQSRTQLVSRFWQG